MTSSFSGFFRCVIVLNGVGFEHLLAGKLLSLALPACCHTDCHPCSFIHTLEQEYRIHNCEILFKEDITVDDLIDIIEGNRKYTKCLYVYNKVRAT